MEKTANRGRPLKGEESTGPISSRATLSTINALKAEARKREWSVAHLIRHALEDFVAREKNSPE